MGNTRPLKVGIIGAGAIGLFYGGHFSRAGASVSIIARTLVDYSNLAKPYIQVNSVDGDFNAPLQAVIQQGDVSDHQPFDVIILSTKAISLIDPVALVKPYMSADTVLLVIQNGIFIEVPLVAAFKQPILRGLAFICAHRESKGVVKHLDFGQLSLGLFSGDGDHPNVKGLFDVLEKVNLSTRRLDNVWPAIWEKLVWNLPFNPLSVVYGGLSTSELLASDDICQRIRELMGEVVIAAAHDGVVLPDDIIEKMIAQTRKMTPYKTSMCLDFMSGQPLEMDAIVGNFLRHCQAQGIDVPFTEALWRDVRYVIY